MLVHGIPIFISIVIFDHVFRLTPNFNKQSFRRGHYLFSLPALQASVTIVIHVLNKRTVAFLCYVAVCLNFSFAITDLSREPLGCHETGL